MRSMHDSPYRPHSTQILDQVKLVSMGDSHTMVVSKSGVFAARPAPAHAPAQPLPRAPPLPAHPLAPDR
jgi:hypothetical protein